MKEEKNNKLWKKRLCCFLLPSGTYVVPSRHPNYYFLSFTLLFTTIHTHRVDRDNRPMSHKVGRAELGGETEQQAGQKRVRVADEAKHHQDSKYRGYKPDFAALARQYPDSFGPLYVVHSLLAPLVFLLLSAFVLSRAPLSSITPRFTSSLTVLLPPPNPPHPLHPHSVSPT